MVRRGKQQERGNFENLIARLRAARQTKGWSQRDLADRMNAGQSHVSRIELGSDVRISTLTEMANLLGIEIMAVPRRLAPAVEALIEAESRPASRENPDHRPLYRLDDDADDQQEAGHGESDHGR